MSQARVWFLKTYYLFHGRMASRLGAPLGWERVGESGRGMKLSVAHLRPRGVGQPWPFSGFTGSRSALSPFVASRQVSVFPDLNVGWIPTQHPQKAGSRLFPENSLLQITALWPFHSSPFGKSWGPGAGGAGGSGGPVWEANSEFREKGVDWEPGGSEAVTEGAVGCARGHGEGWPLTPALGAHPLTTSPPLSAESLCPRRWPSGQCSGPGDMEWSSGLGHSVTTSTDNATDHPHGPQGVGSTLLLTS